MNKNKVSYQNNPELFAKLGHAKDELMRDLMALPWVCFELIEKLEFALKQNAKDLYLLLSHSSVDGQMVALKDLSVKERVSIAASTNDTLKLYYEAMLDARTYGDADLFSGAILNRIVERTRLYDVYFRETFNDIEADLRAAVRAGKDIKNSINTKGKKLPANLLSDIDRYEEKLPATLYREAKALSRKHSMSIGDLADIGRHVLRSHRAMNEALSCILEANKPLIHKSLASLSIDQTTRSEAFQEASIGLIRAAMNFEPSLNCSFSTHATPWIKQAVMKALNFKEMKVSMPDRHIIKHRKIKKHLLESYANECHDPSSVKVAAELEGVTVEEVEYARSSANRFTDVDEVYNMPGTNSDAASGAIFEELTEGLKDAIARLPEREAIVVSCINGIGRQELDLKTTGEMLGISGERVRQLNNQALARLRSLMVDHL